MSTLEIQVSHGEKSTKQLELIQRHYADLARYYPALLLVEGSDGLWIIKGLLEFKAIFNNVELSDRFEIEVHLPSDYPENPPIALEVGGCIPENFHKTSGNILCLETPIGTMKKYASNRNLLGFVTDLLIPYLYSFVYFSKFGHMPYGEFSHGDDGIYEFYKEYFEVGDYVSVLSLLRVLVDSKYHKYRGRMPCPCGRGKRFQNCHGDKVIQLKALHRYDLLLAEYEAVLRSALANGQRIPRCCLSEVLRDKLQREVGRESQGYERHSYGLG